MSLQPVAQQLSSFYISLRFPGRSGCYCPGSLHLLTQAWKEGWKGPASSHALQHRMRLNREQTLWDNRVQQLISQSPKDPRKHVFVLFCILTSASVYQTVHLLPAPHAFNDLNLPISQCLTSLYSKFLTGSSTLKVI